MEEKLLQILRKKHGYPANAKLIKIIPVKNGYYCKVRWVVDDNYEVEPLFHDFVSNDELKERR